jgi:nitrate/nitrite-specific signal transduction histidine kinase
MRERAGRIGASLEVQSRSGAGTTVRLRLGQAQRRAA